MKAIICLGLLSLAGGAFAASDALPRDRLNLTASASVEVTRDVLGIVFSTSKEGSDAATVQTQLKQALEAALTEARKIAKPGQVEVQTGNFSLYPRYAAKGGINGWQGSAELLVEGKDAAAIAQLSGRINTMSIARVGYSLSKEQREKVEGDVTAQAIARFKARAADYARQFGFNGYSIGEVSVNSADPGNMPMAAPPMRFKAMAASADEALPVEAGKASVSVTVNGSVVMTAP
ncbi:MULTISPECIES: SIMPL domain-containing protein [Roseateles]|uniref:SIMPL domain-containing protein n=1 Tax=Roseateles albus TaxID=2987525 RepID=A0ABT5KA86_9BURK|nr:MULTISPECIES: SIMPL domain-containing protein [Roseateles]MCV2357815.1 SIMPL domain-containing protein [Paucibacter sp. TC2R-5]MDC8770861.1 SIMPL domain-containing protein [Roseateles albus]